MASRAHAIFAARHAVAERAVVAVGVGLTRRAEHGEHGIGTATGEGQVDLGAGEDDIALTERIDPDGALIPMAPSKVCVSGNDS